MGHLGIEGVPFQAWARTQHFCENDTSAVDVGTAIDSRGIHKLLRGRIVSRADLCTGICRAREPRLARNANAYRKIKQVVAQIGQDNIVRLHVSMDDSLLVGTLQS